MKIDKFLQKNKGITTDELREKLLDISKLELVEMLIEMVEYHNNNKIEQSKPEPIKVSAEVYNTLTKLIENNFIVVGADGRGRKSLIQEMLDTLGYAESVKKIVEDNTPNSIKNIKLKNLYILEKLRREEKGEDITDFQPTQLNRGLIKNKPY